MSHFLMFEKIKRNNISRSVKIEEIPISVPQRVIGSQARSFVHLQSGCFPAAGTELNHCDEAV